MPKRTLKLVVAMTGIVFLATWCTSSASFASGSGTRTYTIGLLSDLTGIAASADKSSPQGVRAGISWAAKQGYKLNLVEADTTSSPTGLASAEQKLVLEDHVIAVVSVSALLYLDSSFLAKHGVPVVGAAEDGPEWLTSKNMFGSYGATDTMKVGTTYGDFFKMVGVTDFGALGYGISPTSSEAAKGAALSVEHAGIRVGYLNTQFAFGSTNVGPVALAMRSEGVNGFTAPVDPNTGLLLVTALRQEGVKLKAALLPTGYGGDLIQAGPGALQSAQGVYFLSPYEPVEMHTAATTEFQHYLREAGVKGEPTYAEYAGYASIVLLVEGLEAAGAHPTQASLVKGLSRIHDFTAGGLLGSHPINMANRTPSAIDNCVYITKLSGSKFDLVPRADPICGTNIAGENTST